MKIQNAKIEGTMLGFEDHGILTCDVQVDYGDGGHQSFGGYSISGEYASRWIKGILNVVGVSSWEKLKGQHIRVRLGDGYNSRIEAIGNFLKDEWFEAVE